MKRTILATYERKSQLPHYCKSAQAYAKDIIKIECSKDDYSEDRTSQENSGMISYKYNVVTKQKEELKIEDIYYDRYVIITTNSRNVIKQHEFIDKDEANRAFLAIKSQFNNFKRII